MLVARSRPTLQHRGLWPARHLCPWDPPGKNAGLGCSFLLQGIFSTQESNSGLLQHRWILYCLSHQISPLVRKIEIKLLPFAGDKTVENPKESPRQHFLQIIKELNKVTSLV